MAAVHYDIAIEEGSKFILSLTWLEEDGTPVNLTGYSARMQVRETVEAASTIFSIVSGDGITLGGALGTIVAVITATLTAAADFDFGFYDLEVLEGAAEADAIRLIEGKVRFTREVTR